MDDTTDLTTPAGRLKTARLDARFDSAADAARAFGWPMATYTQHENGRRPLSRQAAPKYAKAFRVSASWLLYGDGSSRLKIPNLQFGGTFRSNKISADFDGVANENDTVIGIDGGMIVGVEGDSLIPLAYDTDVLFFGPAQNPRTLIGKEALAELVDGQRLFRVIERGSKPGHYDLMFFNSSPLRDVEITRAHAFLGVRRRR
jgi:hypothetical protein